MNAYDSMIDYHGRDRWWQVHDIPHYFGSRSLRLFGEDCHFLKSNSYRYIALVCFVSLLFIFVVLRIHLLIFLLVYSNIFLVM